MSDRRIRELIDENRILDLKRDLDEAEAQSLAAGIALKRIYKKQGIKHAISFHRSIRAADRFRGQQDALNRLPSPRIQNFHISSKKTAGQRSRLLSEFVNAKRALMTNARCLTEGVDVPAIDCVMFADPKQSRIDIVQAAGRALRKYDGKKYGYIVVPLIVPDGMDFEGFAETTAFRQVAQTITALSTQDERIAEEFRALETGRVSTGKIVEIDGDVPIGMKMKLGDFAEAISTRVWESVGRANRRPFEEARAYVRGLCLASVHGPSGWWNYCNSGRKPVDIPTNPQVFYAEAGWVDWGDWLGTGRIADRDRVYRAFEDAREDARSRELRTYDEWIEFTKSEDLPPDIPVAPWQTYKDKGWKDIGDWLGTGTVRKGKEQFLPFKQARDHARSLRLKSQTKWKAYCKPGKKPKNIPAHPDHVYAASGWVSWGDWLGTGVTATRTRQYRRFHEARAFAHSLGLETRSKWRPYCKSGNKPEDIPARPDNTYAKAGWAGWDDWLGTGRERIRTTSRKRNLRPHEVMNVSGS